MIELKLSKKCSKCGTLMPLDNYDDVTCTKAGKLYVYKRSQCKSCEKESSRIRGRRRTAESRIEERRREAEKKGRVYGGLLKDRHPPVKKAKVEALKAFRLWFDQKSQKEKDEWYENTGKPWNNPKFNSAEKWKSRYSNDLEYHVKERIRLHEYKRKTKSVICDNLRSAIKRGGRSPSSEEIIGCSMHEFIKHFERQMNHKANKGMNWDKFMKSEIVIDHITPKSDFNLDDPKEFKRCWALSNLRPMWAKANIIKSNKREFLI